MSRNIKASANIKDTFSDIKSYSVEEIIAAGGATAFANKMGKSSQSLAERLKAFPKEAFLTDEELSAALKELSENK